VYLQKSFDYSTSTTAKIVLEYEYSKIFTQVLLDYEYSITETNNIVVIKGSVLSVIRDHLCSTHGGQLNGQKQSECTSAEKSWLNQSTRLL